MNHLELYESVSYQIAEKVTRRYSTSFSLGIRLLDKRHRPHIYAIYGFVRLADEIVDTFLEYNRAELLSDFEKQTWAAINDGISAHPVLHAFQKTYHLFDIEASNVRCFLESMSMDLAQVDYDRPTYEKYILGSAEVVGLMCLSVFLDGNLHKYHELKPAAMKLGSAFQKVNFLRDLKADTLVLKRHYFPQVEYNQLTPELLKQITSEIRLDFHDALVGIRKLPIGARCGVYAAYKYYYALLIKIESSTLERIQQERIRIPNWQKAYITMHSVVKSNLLRI